jgi:hypothetical protein
MGSHCQTGVLVKVDPVWPRPAVANPGCIITPNATIKVKATNCSSQKVAMNPINAATPLSVVTDSEAYLSTITVVLHEYFDSTLA